MIPEIHIEDYNYALPEERIAKYPLKERDASKLLHYKNGIVSEHCFTELPQLLPQNSLMVFNETKVVPARLHFTRSSGAHIEVFCLEPVSPAEYNLSFAASEKCIWKCVIGNAKRWKDDLLSLYNPDGDERIASMGLVARLVSREDRTGTVEFSWKDSSPFSTVLERCGTIPIPPYLKRESESIDAERYQTLYARERGSVAAPTAGLHFTERVLDEIRRKGIDIQKLCLHVGAGTFLPVKTSCISEHPMHREPFVIQRSLLEKLRTVGVSVTAVGTTSVRTLESLYYAGVSCLENGAPADIEQWAPYTRSYPYSTEEALQALLDYMARENMECLTLGTRIIIVPGFEFRIVDRMVTNFHQPESTLILLVSAFVGGDWRKIYDFALERDFRFLSYGDSSLLER